MMMRQLTRARAGDLTVGQLTLTELQAEISRRVETLQAEREKLTSRLEEIERQLEEVTGESAGSLPASAGGPRRRRPRNDRPLSEYVIEVLAGNELTTRQIADAVIERGYRTNSSNFANNVTAALHRDDRFVRANGKWSMSASAPTPEPRSE